MDGYPWLGVCDMFDALIECLYEACVEIPISCCWELQAGRSRDFHGMRRSRAVIVPFSEPFRRVASNGEVGLQVLRGTGRPFHQVLYGYSRIGMY